MNRWYVDSLIFVLFIRQTRNFAFTTYPCVMATFTINAKYLVKPCPENTNFLNAEYHTTQK